MSDSVSCAIANDLRELGKVNDALGSFCARHAIAPETISELELALEEVVTNVIRHGYRDEEEHEIRIRIGMENGQLAMAVEDDGLEFNPLKQPPPDLDLPIEERPIGGLGIHLVIRLMDEIEYTRVDGMNRLVMRKRVAAA
jgi:anti-sigma regulatory factor (Ser/Thr protein kinase)